MSSSLYVLKNADLHMQSWWLMLLIHRLGHVYITIPQTTHGHTRCTHMSLCLCLGHMQDGAVFCVGIPGRHAGGSVLGLKLKIQTSASLRLTSIVLSREPTLFLRPRFPVTQLADVSHNCIVCVCVWVSVMAISVNRNLTFLLVSTNVEIVSNLKI